MPKRRAECSDDESDVPPAKSKAERSVGPANGSTAPTTKKAKTATSSSPAGKTAQQILSMTESALEASTKDQLVSYVVTLQAAAAAARQRSAAASGSGTATAAPLSKEKAAQQAQMYRESIAKGIKKQLTWKSSCKTGGARFSYETIIPNRSVMLLALGRPEDEKMWKQKKVSIDDLQKALGRLYGSARYDTLNILNRNKDPETNPECVTLRYDDDGKLTISGSYGTGR